MPTETITKPPAPKTDELEQLKQDALAWVNEYRTCRELPRGMGGQPSGCPIGRALGASISQAGFWFWGYPNRWYDTPSRVSEFIRAFDRGDYPELIA